MPISIIRLIAGRISLHNLDFRALLNSQSTLGTTFTQQSTCQTPGTTSISMILLVAIRFGKWVEEEYSLMPSLSMMFQHTSITLFLVEKGCPLLHGWHTMSECFSSLASLTPVSICMFKMKEVTTVRALQQTNGELSTTIQWMAMSRSIQMT